MKNTAFVFLSLSFSAISSPVPQSTSDVQNSTNIQNNTDVQTSTDSQSSPINGLLAAAVMSPFIGAEVSALSGTITAFEQVLATILNVDTTEDAASGCAPMTVIFARGTTESGNVGLLSGPPFFDALTAMLGSKNVTVQGVNYPASIEGFLEGGDPAGSQVMATMIQNTIDSCPDTKVVMAGYSQGGQLVHNAAKLLPAKTMGAVSSVVIFGDPNFGQAVAGASASKTMVICHPDDNICQHGDIILLAHLTYSENAVQAATFATAQAGLAINS